MIKENFELIFHAYSGVTLQTDNYCHYFKWSPNDRYFGNNEKIPTIWVSKLLRGGTTESWEGNEPNQRIEDHAKYTWQLVCYNQDKVIEIVSEQDVEKRAAIIENLIGDTEVEVFSDLWNLMDK